MILAQALGVSYDELISLKLTKDLDYLSTILKTNIIGGMPFDIFGIPAQTIFQLMAEHPQKFGALVGTVLEMARTHDMKVEDFFFATLKSYLDMNQNYFPNVEQKVIQFREKSKLSKEEHLRQFLTSTTLINFLTVHYKYKIHLQDFSDYPEELHHHFFFISPTDFKKFFLNANLSEREKVFILVKEIGYNALNLKERLLSSRTYRIDSYAKVHHNFLASYFAGALIIPKDSFVKGIKTFIKLKNWDNQLFLRLVTGYRGTIESYFHRLSQVLPTFLKMKDLFLLKFHFNTQNRSFYLDKELHLSKLHDPHEVKSNEHYCRRWITFTLIEKLLSTKKDIVAGSQRSSFYGKGNEYLCLSVAWHSELDPNIKICMTIGILLHHRTEMNVNFLSDPRIPRRQVGDICEKCGVHDCRERMSTPYQLYEKNKEEKAQDAMETAIQSVMKN